MVKDVIKFNPQLVIAEHLGLTAVALTDKQKLSLYKKSQQSGYPTSILEEVYNRGVISWEESTNKTPEQYAFDRINSFISGGLASEIDEDLKKACWKGYEAIGMKKKNGKTVPNCVPEQTAEKQSKNKNDPSSRFDATTSLVNIYSKDTPGEKVHESRLDIIKRVVVESQVCADCDCGLAEEVLNERGADSKGYYRSTESGAGLTAKGAKHFGIQTAVTETNPKGKRAARRRSFCARMGGMKGPMKDEKGRPTRKAMSLRRWRC